MLINFLTSVILYYASAIMLPKVAPESWTEFAKEKDIKIEDMMSGEYFFRLSVKYQPKHIKRIWFLAVAHCCPLR